MKNPTRFLFSLMLIMIVSMSANLFLGANPLLVGSLLFGLGAVKALAFPSFQMPSNMAYDFVISDTTYAGEAATRFIVKAITNNETVQGGHAYVKDGIKKKFTIPRLAGTYTSFIQARQATPVSAGTLTVDGKTLEPADYMIYFEFNPRDYEQHWFATQLNPTLIDTTLPATPESQVVQEILKYHDRYINESFWKSKTTGTAPFAFYNGWIKKAVDDADTIDVPTPTTLSAANIIAEFQEGFDLIPAALKYDPKMKFFVGYAAYDFYMQAQIAQTYKGGDITGLGVKPTFRGLEVVKIPDFPADTYMIAKGTPDETSNMWIGMNSTEDAKIEMAKLQANSELFFMKMLMKVDVQIGWGAETVLYGTI
jgi:hypothetical protein